MVNAGLGTLAKAAKHLQYQTDWHLKYTSGYGLDNLDHTGRQCITLIFLFFS
jgi:hypothetical protein